MKLYRYFYSLADPFVKITDINSDNTKEYIEFIKNKNLASKTYNKDYIDKRLDTEKKIRQEFIKKGGKPELKHPHYFVLENCDYWFYHIKNTFASLVIDSSKFSKDVISFTYGDSIPTFDDNFDDGKEYRKKVYTIDEIAEIIDKYSLPQLWNQNAKYGIENYIEVQIWTDDVISDYRFTGVNNIYKSLDLFYESAIDGNKRIKTIINDFPQQISLVEIKKVCNNSKMLKEFYSKFKKIYDKDIMHGIEHSYRTAIYMLLMGEIANVDKEFLRTMVFTAFAHDIGRKRATGEEHGKISANMLGEISGNVADIESIKKAITAHSVENFNLYIDLNANDDRTKKLILWLKDVDTLDYIRFGIRTYAPNILRTEEAKKLLKIAVELNIYMYIFPNDDYNIINLEENNEK